MGRGSPNNFASLRNWKNAESLGVFWTSASNSHDHGRDHRQIDAAADHDQPHA
jgi:hypothetical protein